MKVVLDPMAGFVADAEKLLSALIHQPHGPAHFRKREIALSVVSGGPSTPEFDQAADIEGLSVPALAELIVGKPDDILAADNRRRAFTIRIRAARNKAEIDEILREAGALV